MKGLLHGEYDTDQPAAGAAANRPRLSEPVARLLGDEPHPLHVAALAPARHASQWTPAGRTRRHGRPVGRGGPRRPDELLSDAIAAP